MLESCLNIVNPISERITSLEQSDSTTVAGIAALTKDVANVQNKVDANGLAITNVQNTVDGNKSALETLQNSVNTANSNGAKESTMVALTTKIAELEAKLDSIIENGESTNSKYSYDSLIIGEMVAVNHSTYGKILFEVIGKDIDGEGTVTLLSRDIITEIQWNRTSNGNYSESSIRTWLNGTFYNGFDSTIKPLIKQVAKTQNMDASVSTETSLEYCWLLSREEITNNTYTLGNKLKYFGGSSPTSWWSRSPDTSTNTNAYYITSSAGVSRGAKTSTQGVVPVIVI